MRTRKQISFATTEADRSGRVIDSREAEQWPMAPQFRHFRYFTRHMLLREGTFVHYMYMYTSQVTV